MKKTEKIQRATKLRNKISAERPEFNRSETHRFPRLGRKWRSSKGIRSKMRLKKRSRAAIVETGYRGPVIARGLRTDGSSEVLVSTIKDLEKVDPETQVVRLAATLGKRKRLEMIKKAEELKIRIVNIRASEKPSLKLVEEEKEAKAEKKVTPEPEKEPEEAKTVEEEEE